jgi:hypothetical protein
MAACWHHLLEGRSQALAAGELHPCLYHLLLAACPLQCHQLRQQQ